MCIAIYKPLGKKIKPEALTRCFEKNPHGMGFSAIVGRKIVTHKGYFDPNQAIEALKPYMSRTCIIHYRLASHGAIGLDNCHPFEVTTRKFQFSIIHNGILDYTSTEEKSDTLMWVEEILTPILTKSQDFPFTKHGKWVLEKSIGVYNKIIILRNDGKVCILNEDAMSSLWDKGVWYSNKGYRHSVNLNALEFFNYKDIRI